MKIFVNNLYMKILVACEFSGIVREAFAARGHDAWSCDLIASEQPGQHLIMDNDMHLKDTLYSRRHGWDMVIGHPDCFRLTNSVIWYIKKHGLQEEVYNAAVFFNMILHCPAKKICVENPIQHGLARQYIEKYDQIIQPYRFGNDASKATCLWLKGLPKLHDTDYFPPRRVYKNGKWYDRWSNQTDGGWNKLPPGENRSKDRSRTYTGIAKAMAEQWG
jgi:hypothetical protein